MDNYLYQCRYCGNHYRPKKRYKQLFCSSSCRVNSHNKNKKQSLSPQVTEATKDINNPLKIEKMSWSGIGNAAAGTIAVDAITHLLTKEENRPATKKDIKEIITALKQRYFMVKNMNPKPEGTFPYFDIQTSTIVYYKPTKK
jgi:hypothetical protein